LADSGRYRPTRNPRSRRARAHTLPSGALERLPGRFGRPRRRRTRWRPGRLVITLPRGAYATNRSPDIGARGSSSQRRTSRPRTGKAVEYVVESRATRRRDVAESPTTSKTGNTTALPPAVVRQLGGEAGLAIECVEHLLAVGNDRLDLDHEHHPRRRVKGEYVDRAALAPDGERDLDRHLPARLPQRGRHQLHEVRVSLVEQSIKLS